MKAGFESIPHLGTTLSDEDRIRYASPRAQATQNSFAQRVYDSVFDGTDSISERHASYRRMMPQLQGMVLSKVPQGGVGDSQHPSIIMGSDDSGAVYNVRMPTLFTQPENPNKRMTVMPAGPLESADGPYSQGLVRRHDGKHRSKHGSVTMQYWQQEYDRDKRRTLRARQARLDAGLDAAGVPKLPGTPGAMMTSTVAAPPQQHSGGDVLAAYTSQQQPMLTMAQPHAATPRPYSSSSYHGDGRSERIYDDAERGDDDLYDKSQSKSRRRNRSSLSLREDRTEETTQYSSSTAQPQSQSGVSILAATAQNVGASTKAWIANAKRAVVTTLGLPAAWASHGATGGTAGMTGTVAPAPASSCAAHSTDVLGLALMSVFIVLFVIACIVMIVMVVANQKLRGQVKQLQQSGNVRTGQQAIARPGMQSKR
jgi:hypothetical protein